jgi:manganese/iron transport system substrate-binding protein
MRVLVLLVLVLVFPLGGLACGPAAAPPAAAPPAGTLLVVTTVAPITSIVENIGGTRISVQGVVPEGVNSHTFEPAPSMAGVLSRADLIVLNGLFLEEPTLEMALANKKAGAVILALGDQAISQDEWAFDFSFPASEGHPNPHLWPDPLLALKYAELVKVELAEVDPANANYYSTNLERFRQRIQALDTGIRVAVQSVPPENRRLLTYHDSWAYFAKRYGMQVIGAVQPSDFSEPSAKEVADLIDQIRAEKVPAVFGSEVFPSRVMETIAKEAGARYVDELRDDDLPGVPGEPRHSYLGLMLQNMEIMVPALGGRVDSLASVDPRPVFDGPASAVYPQ